MILLTAPIGVVWGWKWQFAGVFFQGGNIWHVSKFYQVSIYEHLGGMQYISQFPNVINIFSETKWDSCEIKVLDIPED